MSEPLYYQVAIASATRLAVAPLDGDHKGDNSIDAETRDAARKLLRAEFAAWERNPPTAEEDDAEEADENE